MPDTDFERALSALLQLRERGAVRLLITPGFGRLVVQFEMLQQHAEVEQLLADHAMTRETFETAADEVSRYLAGALLDWSLAHLQRLDENAEESAVQQKMSRVRDAFAGDLDKLKKRVWLKTSAKTQVPKVFEWGVSVKQTDSDRAQPAGGPVASALLRIGGEVPDVTALFGTTTDSVTLTVDEEDVAYMVDSLERLRQALRNVEGGN